MRTIIICLLLINLLIGSTSEARKLNFSWPYIKNSEWHLTISIPDKHLAAVKNMRGNQRRSRGWEYITPEDKIIKKIAAEIATIAKDNDYDEAQFILSFVQGGIKNAPDAKEYQYSKYPMETFVEGGDCEDKSYLAASLLLARGYAVVLVWLAPGHYGIAIQDESQKIGSPNFRINGKKYYYGETTSSGWYFGEIPEQFKSKKIIVIDEKNTLTDLGYNPN